MGYILVFLVCHSPRLMLNIYELFTIRHAVLCQENGHDPFPAWSLLLMCFSHFLLILNSSINILIYSLLSSKFREEMGKLFRCATLFSVTLGTHAHSKSQLKGPGLMGGKT